MESHLHPPFSGTATVLTQRIHQPTIQPPLPPAPLPHFPQLSTVSSIRLFPTLTIHTFCTVTTHTHHSLSFSLAHPGIWIFGGSFYLYTYCPGPGRLAVSFPLRPPLFSFFPPSRLSPLASRFSTGKLIPLSSPSPSSAVASAFVAGCVVFQLTPIYH